MASNSNIESGKRSLENPFDESDEQLSISVKSQKTENSFVIETTNEKNEPVQIKIYQVDLGKYQIMYLFRILVLNSKYKTFINTPLLDEYMNKRLNSRNPRLFPTEEENILLESVKTENNIFSYYFLTIQYQAKYYETKNQEYLDKIVENYNILIENGFIDLHIILNICFLKSNNIIEFEKYYTKFIKYRNAFSKISLSDFYNCICDKYHLDRNLNSPIYKECAEYLHKNNKNYFHYSLVFKESEPNRFLELLNKGIYNKCMYSKYLYCGYMINKYRNNNYNFELNILVKNEIEKIVNFSESVCDTNIITRDKKIQLLSNIVLIYEKYGNNSYANIYLDKLLNEYNYIPAGIKLSKYYTQKRDFDQMIRYETKLAELNYIKSIISLIIIYENKQNHNECQKYETMFVEFKLDDTTSNDYIQSIKNLIEHYKFKKNYTKSVQYIEMIKNFDDKYYKDELEKFKLLMERNDLKFKPYPEKEFECPITFTKLSNSVILSCCKNEVGYWFLFSDYEIKCPYCRHEFF